MGKERQLPVLYVVESGSPDFQRWMISDDRDRLWNGQDFGQNGVLYARHNDAAVDAQNILRGHFGGIQSVKYVVPVFVESLSHLPVSVAEVAQYLSRASRLTSIRRSMGMGRATVWFFLGSSGLGSKK